MLRCAICGRTDNLVPMVQSDFHQTCFEHRAFAATFQLPHNKNADIAELTTSRALKHFFNLPALSPIQLGATDIRCGVCDRLLTSGERLSIAPNHFTKTCSEHRHFATTFNILPVRQRFTRGLPLS